MPNSFYVPDDVPLSYKYVVPGNNYYDLYNTPVLWENNTYTYYRFYNSLDPDLYKVYSRTTGYTSLELNAITVDTTHDYHYREDFPQIITTVFIYVVFLVFLINIITSMIRRGGILGGLL